MIESFSSAQVTIASDSLDDFIKKHLAEATTNAFKETNIPEQNIKLPHPPETAGHTTTSNYNCHVYNGHVQSINTYLDKCTNQNSKYNVEMHCNFTIIYKNFDEGYDYMDWSGNEHVPPHFGHENCAFSNFTITIGKLSVNANITININNTSVSVDSLTAVPSNISFTLPNGCLLNQPGTLSCVQDRINSEVETHIAKTDFSSPLKTALENLLKLSKI